MRRSRPLTPRDFGIREGIPLGDRLIAASALIARTVIFMVVLCPALIYLILYAFLPADFRLRRW
jgi:hypothetical protein